MCQISFFASNFIHYLRMNQFSLMHCMLLTDQNSIVLVKYQSLASELKGIEIVWHIKSENDVAAFIAFHGGPWCTE